MNTETKKLSDKIIDNDLVLETDVPEGGIRIYIDDQHHWVLSKMDMITWKKVKKLMRMGQDDQAVVWAIQRLLVAGTIDPQKLIDEVDYMLALEEAVASMVEPVTVQIKKK